MISGTSDPWAWKLNGLRGLSIKFELDHYAPNVRNMNAYEIIAAKADIKKISDILAAQEKRNGS